MWKNKNFLLWVEDLKKDYKTNINFITYGLANKLPVTSILLTSFIVLVSRLLKTIIIVLTFNYLKPNNKVAQKVIFFTTALIWAGVIYTLGFILYYDPGHMINQPVMDKFLANFKLLDDISTLDLDAALQKDWSDQEEAANVKISVEKARIQNLERAEILERAKMLAKNQNDLLWNIGIGVLVVVGVICLGCAIYTWFYDPQFGDTTPDVTPRGERGPMRTPKGGNLPGSNVAGAEDLGKKPSKPFSFSKEKLDPLYKGPSGSGSSASPASSIASSSSSSSGDSVQTVTLHNVDKPILDKSPKLEVEFPDSSIGNITPKPSEAASSNLQQPTVNTQPLSPNTLEYNQRMEGWNQTAPTRVRGPFNVINKVIASSSEAVADNNTFTNSTNNSNFSNSNISNTGLDSRSTTPTASNIIFKSGEGETLQMTYTTPSYSGAPKMISANLDTAASVPTTKPVRIGMEVVKPIKE
jgi:hypothetical protein